LCSNFVKFGRWEVGEIVRCLLPEKIRLAVHLSLLHGSRPKSDNLLRVLQISRLKDNMIGFNFLSFCRHNCTHNERCTCGWMFSRVCTLCLKKRHMACYNFDVPQPTLIIYFCQECYRESKQSNYCVLFFHFT